MKQLTIVSLCVVVCALLFFSCQNKPAPIEPVVKQIDTATVAKKAADCLTITNGEILYSAGHYLEGEPIPTGFDPYGYNYQGHMFKGSYANVYLGGAGFPPYEGDDASYLAANPTVVSHWAWPYRDTHLLMKWNDAWIANTDCDGDGKLDRHYGFDTYIGSGAWETNHQKGTNSDGTKWNYFCKIIAVPDDAVLTAGIWYTADGKEIGPSIWGQFATIQEVYNDFIDGEKIHEKYISPAGPGFGKWK